MSAVVRICWLFFTGFPIQRWLAVAGVVLLALAVAAGALTGEMRLWVPLAFTALFILVVFPAVVAAGAILRVLSAPKSHQLFAHFRVRALLAFVLFVVTVIAIVAVPAVGILASRNAPLELALVYPIGLLTAIVLSVFVVSAQWNWVWLEIPLVIAFFYWLDGDGADRAREAGLSFPWVAGTATLLAWIVFAIWYLRVRRVRPLMIAPPMNQLSGWRGGDEPLARVAAARALVAGRPERPLALQLLYAAAIAALVSLGLLLLPLLPGQTDAPPALTRFVWPFWAMLGIVPFVYAWVHQSRLLWLHVPGPRAQTWRFVERMIARRFVVALVFIVTVAVVVSLLFAKAPSEALWGIALASSAGLYAIYLGLAAVRGFALLGAGFMLMFILQIALLEPAFPVAQVGSPLAVVLVQLGAAAALRALAVRRWRDVDWLQLRPIRFGSGLGRG
jgi:hypothetical protein